MKLRLLIEEFKKSFKSKLGDQYVEIFVNPSRREMAEVSKKLKGTYYIRFIANPQKKELYVFTPSIVHREAASQLGEKGTLPTGGDIWGVAELQGSKWVASYSDSAGYSGVSYAKKVLSKNWDWIKMIDISPLLKKIKDISTLKSSRIQNTNLEPIAFREIKK